MGLDFELQNTKATQHGILISELNEPKVVVE